MDPYEKYGGASAPMGTLLDGIFADAKNLLAHELKLSKLEFRLEIQKIQTSVVLLGVAAVFLAIGATLVAMMAAQLISLYALVPLWSSYGMVGGALILIGALVMFSRGSADE